VNRSLKVIRIDSPHPWRSRRICGDASGEAALVAGPLALLPGNGEVGGAIYHVAIRNVPVLVGMLTALAREIPEPLIRP